MQYQKQVSLKDITGKMSNVDPPQDLEALRNELTGICLFVTSTFGNGDPPKSGEGLAEWMDVQLTKKESSQHHNLSIDHDADEANQPHTMSRSGKTLNRRRAMAEKKILGDLR